MGAPTRQHASPRSLATTQFDRDLESHELRDLANEIAGRGHLWSSLVRHDPQERVYERLYRDEHVEVWLICWMDDQDTGFHDHDLSAGAVAVVSGAVREDRLVLGGPPRSRLVVEGETFSFATSDIHRVLHAGDQPAVTVHAYSPPLGRMGAYVVEPDGQLRRRALSCEEELRPLTRRPGQQIG